MFKHKFTLSLSLVFLAIIAIIGIFKLSAYEKQRDIGNWRITLGALADTKAQTVNSWLDSHLTSLVELAENPSLQMYTQHLDRSKESRKEDPAQLTYLRTLIESTAIRTGFTPQTPKQTIKANVPFREDQSLALYTSDLTLLAATKGTIPLTDNLRIDMANGMLKGKPTLLKMEKHTDTAPSIGFLIPVYGLQKGAKQEPVGILHGRLSPTTSLFPLLNGQTSSMGKSIETYIVRENDSLITYVSPLRGSGTALAKQLAKDLSLVAAKAVQQPGVFGQGHDYTGKQVLFTSRELNHLGWFLIQKISAEEALKESKQHSRFLLWTFLLLLLLTMAVISIVWKHGASIRQQVATELLQKKSEELSKQTTLLNSISDNMSDLILLVDEQDTILFINQAFAYLCNADADTIAGKKLSNLLGPDPADILHKFYGHTSKPLHHKRVTLHLNNGRYEFLASTVAINYGETGKKAHLVSLHDITRLNEKMRQNENLMKQTIQALMRAIDQHDPYSANHSAKTAELVEKIAVSMNLSDHNRQGLIIAATLCNLGKLSIPKEILSKTGKLTQEEKNLLAQETNFATDILVDVDFSWPVAKTISLKTEFLDGSGTPKGLSGEEISQAGRILATANSFIAMTSPRAYRQKLSDNEALNQLLELSDTLYDRKVVAALFNIIEKETA